MINKVTVTVINTTSWNNFRGMEVKFVSSTIWLCRPRISDKCYNLAKVAARPLKPEKYKEMFIETLPHNGIILLLKYFSIVSGIEHIEFP